MPTLRTTTVRTASALLLPLLLLLGPGPQPQGADAFLLTGLSSRVRSPAQQQTTGPLFSVDLQQRGPPRLDEFGLPLEEEAKAPTKPLKDQLYDALDGAQGLVDTYILRSGESDVEQRRLEESTREAIQRRRAANQALKVKDKVLVALDYSLHPGKAWHDFVAAPLHEARERERIKKEARRRNLEQALQRYQAAKSRFYETLDLVQESTRTTVKVAKKVKTAVEQAPETAQGVKVKVSKVVNTLTGLVGKPTPTASTTTSIPKTKTDAPRAVPPVMANAKAAVVEGQPGAPPAEAVAAADPEKVKEIWEPPKTATPPAPAAVMAAATPVTTRLSFRQRLDLEEKQGRFGRARRAPVAAAAAAPAPAPAAAAAVAPVAAVAEEARPKVGPRA